MTRAEERAYHRAFGLHSNIPECCVEFFINVWHDRMLSTGSSPYERAVHHAKAQYVQCPECLGTGYVQELRECVKECGGYHQWEFMPGGANV